MEISLAFAEQIDQSGFVGDGTPTDLDVNGITKRLKDINGTDDGGGLVLGSGSNGAGWSGLVEDDFHKLASKLPMYRGISPAWYTSPEFFWRIMNPIQLSAGGVTRAEFAGEQSLQFLGRPVRFVQVMPKTEGNSQIPCLYGDLRLSSTLGRRQDLTVEESRDARFEQRQVAVLGTERVAINNHSLGDANNPGPMVGLITPAA
jgi:HK97 family phage major capsid protein